MWTSGTILPETATVQGSPATLTWGKLNLEIVKYYKGCLFVLYNTYRRTMHFVRVIKCGRRKVSHTCCEGTTHICMRDSVSIVCFFQKFSPDFSIASKTAWNIIDGQLIC